MAARSIVGPGGLVFTGIVVAVLLAATVCVAGDSPLPLPDRQRGLLPVDPSTTPGGMPKYNPRPVLPRLGPPDLPGSDGPFGNDFRDDASKLEALRGQRDELRDRYTDRHPEVIDIERRIRSLEAAGVETGGAVPSDVPSGGVFTLPGTF